VAVSAAAVASFSCSSDDDDGGNNGNTGGEGGSGNTSGGGDAGSGNNTANNGGDAGSGSSIPDECQEGENGAYLESLGTQPSLGTTSKEELSETVTWDSMISGSDTVCSVTLRFKDLNGNGELDAYEDWRNTPEERAADLVSRLSDGEKRALLLHPSLADAPSSSDSDPSSSVTALIDKGVRFGRTSANDSSVTPRAEWANAIQTLCEATSLGIPFILSSEPAHSGGAGRVKAKGFSQWPNELGLAAGGDTEAVKNFGAVVAAEYRAIGITMALSPAANLFTDPRWQAGQFSFGEDSTKVGEMVAAYVEGLQGESLGQTSVATVVGNYPGAGAAKGGWDGRLEKGQYLSYPGNNIDAHLSPFDDAIAAGATGVMPAYGIPETGAWSGADGTLKGDSIEQVGASFNSELITDGLRDHSGFTGLVLAPWGVLDDAPWGVDSLSTSERLAKAVNAGVDQFGGLDDIDVVTGALDAGLITQAQVDAAATRALILGFELGLFEDPYVDADEASALVNTDENYRSGLSAMNKGMVLVLNEDKPSNWLNGDGDGTQSGDKGNAGNGSLNVLPAPPGEPYVAAGCSFYVMGNFDLDYVTSVAAGYGTLTNDATSVNGVTVSTAAERIAMSDYVFVRMDTPFTADPDSGDLGLSDATLSYSSEQLADLTEAREAIDGWTGSTPTRTQIVVGIDGGRPPVVTELLDFDISALYIQWAGSVEDNKYADKVFLDVAFGIVDGVGTLPVGFPLSDEAMSSQDNDVAGDGQHATFVSDFGLTTAMFQ
jgi:beta-glucosidase